MARKSRLIVSVVDANSATTTAKEVSLQKEKGITSVKTVCAEIQNESIS